MFESINSEIMLTLCVKLVEDVLHVHRDDVLHHDVAIRHRTVLHTSTSLQKKKHSPVADAVAAKKEKKELES